MHLVCLRTSNGPQLALDRSGTFIPLEAPAEGNLTALLAGGPESLTAVLPRKLAQGFGDASTPLDPPLLPGKIVAVGLNYLDHIRETGDSRPDTPLVFAKFPSSVIGPNQAIVIDPEQTQRVDWEVELGVVIGERMHRVDERRSLAGVFGYTVANDVSARDVQFSDGQWVRGKSFDTFCPLGPAIVTPDELSNPQELRLTTRVNDELMQDSNTSEMLFGIGELISFCSYSFTWEPGDLLLTGTPWGCGEFMTPRRSLRPGDVVEVEIESIGKLRNPVEGVSEAQEVKV